MSHTKLIAVGAGVLLLVLVALRDVVPPKWQKPIGVAVGLLGGLAHYLAAGDSPLDAVDHMIVGGALGALAGHLAPGPRVDVGPPTPRTAKPPPLPLLAMVLLALGACTPAERATAQGIAQVAVPGCTVGLSIADAPELAPICATIPEIEAAIAALFAERHAAAGTMAEHASIAAWSPTGAEVHRKIVRMRAAVIGGAK